MDVGRDGPLRDELDEWADELHQLNEELRAGDPSDHVDGSLHDWQLIIEWGCECGKREAIEQRGGSSRIPCQNKNGATVGKDEEDSIREDSGGSV